MSAPWPPLLTGDLADRAFSVVEDVAAAIARGEGRPPAGLTPNKLTIWQSALSAGAAGQSLLHAYLAFDGRGDSHADLAIELLDKASDAAATVQMPETLYS